MGKVLVPALASLLGVTVALAFMSVFTGRPHSARGPGENGTLSSSPPRGTPGAFQQAHAKALKLLQEGHLREAQDEFLEALSLNPNDEDALHGLMVVRRYMAGNNPRVLRRQAAEYWDAIKRGVETEDHYTRQSMEILIVASVQAAREIEAQNTPTSHPLGNPTKPSMPIAAPQRADKPLPGEEVLPPLMLSAKPTGPQTPPPSGRKLPPAAAPAAKPIRSQTPLPPTAPTPKWAEVPPTPPALRILPPPTAPAANPTGPQTPLPPTAPTPKGAEVPPTPPAPGILPPPTAPAANQTVPQTPPPSTAPAPRGAEVPPTSPALRILPPPTAAAPQASPPAPDNRLYTVRVGFSDRDRAAAIAKQLAAGGFAQTKVTVQTGFRVVSEPLSRSAAEGLVATLAGRGFHSQVEPLTGDTVQLLFGTFTSQKDAETLSRRIAGAGYDAWVREGTVYLLQLGPYPQSSVGTITGIIKSGAPEATVIAVPVP